MWVGSLIPRPLPVFNYTNAVIHGREVLNLDKIVHENTSKFSEDLYGG